MEEETTDIRQCREYLRQLGFGPRELAVLDPSDSEDIARQLASELSLPMRNTLVSFVEKLVQDSKEPAKLAARADGQLASYVEWINTWGVPEAATEFVSEWVPPVGTKKLRPGKTIAPEEERGARLQRLLEIWTGQLLEELRHMDAPVLKKLESCLDRVAAERMLPGKTRATTVKRYVSYYRQWRQWLHEAKSVSMPGTEADLIDYLMARWEEPCGRTIPEVLLKSVTWMERVAEFPDSSRTTTGRAVWSIKDRIVEALSIDAPVTKRAPRYPVFLLAAIERYVMDESEPAIWRVLAWAKLVKVWACLRWDDLQEIKPAELTFADGRVNYLAQDEDVRPQTASQRAPGLRERKGLLCGLALARLGL